MGLKFEKFKAQKGFEKANAYAKFFEYVKRRLLKFDVRTVGDLPAEELRILAEKQSALLEKYGPTEFGPF